MLRRSCFTAVVLLQKLKGHALNVVRRAAVASKRAWRVIDYAILSDRPVNGQLDLTAYYTFW